MKRLGVAIAVMLMMPLLAGTAFAGGANTVVEDIPLNRTVFVGCARNGLGDTIVLTGQLHTVLTAVSAPKGTVVVRESFTPMRVVGTGEGGDVYRGAGSTTTITVTGAAGSATTALNSFLVVGPGPGNNLVIHTVLRFVVGTDGVDDVVVDQVRITCR
jgi:hypothetical protein